MGKGHIKDEDISASSAFDLKSVGPHLARLDMDLNGGAWCPKKVIEPGVREWIEIDLQRPYRISRTATQGRYGGGQGQEYAEEFLLEYWRPSLKEWKTYRQVTYVDQDKLKDFIIFPVGFLIPIIFSNLNSNCSNY